MSQDKLKTERIYCSFIASRLVLQDTMEKVPLAKEKRQPNLN